MGVPHPKPQPPVEVENPSGSTNIKQDAGNSLIEFNLDSNGDGSGLTMWSILLIVAATLIAVYILKRLRTCRKKAKLQRSAQQARLEAIALMPCHAFDNDRFEEIDVRVDRQIEAQAPPPAVQDQPEVPAGNQRRHRRG